MRDAGMLDATGRCSHGTTVPPSPLLSPSVAGLVGGAWSLAPRTPYLEIALIVILLGAVSLYLRYRGRRKGAAGGRR